MNTAHTSKYRYVQTYLFDTCTHKCGYCYLAETGRVLDHQQLEPYRRQDFIEQIAGFFNLRTDTTNKWTLILTGGEPLIMPNFEYFSDLIFSKGNRLVIYSALFIDSKVPAFRYLLDHGAPQVEYIMASFHPEAEEHEDAFFEKLRLLKNAGHRLFLRFVAHPKRLDLLERLNGRCRDLDVCFYPTTLFSKDYPMAYTADERSRLSDYFTSISQMIQLDGGIDTKKTLCRAGDSLLSLNVLSGEFTPCISVQEPVIGNLYKNELHLFDREIRCPKAGMACNCDIHYQQNIVLGAEDGDVFEKLKNGYAVPVGAGELEKMIRQKMIRLAKSGNMGIGQVENDTILYYSLDQTKAAFREWKTGSPAS